jgi:branched-chain amino acid transport system substrate-binding protein
MAAHTIIVGASLSLSGGFAPQGRQAHAGLTLWAEDTNRAGGMLVDSGQPHRPVRLQIHDDGSKRAVAAALTRQLLTADRVDLLFGPYSSVLALAAAEVAAEFDRTLWNHGGSSDAMVGRGWQHVVNLLSPASSYFVPLVEMAVQSAGRPIRTVALLHGARGTFPAAVTDGAAAHAHALGLEVVLRAAYPEETAPRQPDGETSPRQPDGETSPPQPPSPARRGGSTNHQVLVGEIAARRPDVILGVGTTEADIELARELRAQGVTPALVGLVAAAVQPFRDALGADADGFCGPSQWEPTLQDQPELGPTSAAFAQAFRARFKAEPDYTAAQAYAVGLIAANCVELAGSLNDHAIRAAAANLDTSTFYGRFRTDPGSGQQIGHQLIVVQWQAGRKEIVWPPAAATSTFRAPC